MGSIGRYRVIRELGSGGMARVTLAENELGREVVIKRPLKDDTDSYDRLLDEAQAGARLDHPHIVKTLDFFTEDGVPHLVVAYVPGRSLLDLRDDGPLHPGVVIRIGRQISDALRALHAATDGQGAPLHMLHRDISPSNIVLGGDGDARLIDLGIARSTESVANRTRSGFLRGKIQYLAPELFFGCEYTAASDLWALGLVLLEAALGRRVLTGGQPEVIAQIVAGNVMQLRPGELIDPALEGSLLRLLHPNPDSRLARASDASALFRMLEAAVPDAPKLAVSAVRGELVAGTEVPAVVGTLLEPRAATATSPARASSARTGTDNASFGFVSAAIDTELLEDPFSSEPPFDSALVEAAARGAASLDAGSLNPGPLDAGPTQPSRPSPRRASLSGASTPARGVQKPLVGRATPPAGSVKPSAAPEHVLEDDDLETVHSHETSILSQVSGSWRLSSERATAQEQLLKYVVQLRALSAPGAVERPPTVDPWAMDSDPWALDSSPG